MAFRNGIKIFRRYFEHNIALRLLNNNLKKSANLKASNKIVHNLTKNSEWFSHTNDKHNHIERTEATKLHALHNNEIIDVPNILECAELPFGFAAPKTAGITHLKNKLNKMAVISIKPGVRHYHTNRALTQIGANITRKLLNQELTTRKLLHRAIYLSSKRFIHPIRECPRPPPRKKICGYLEPPKEEGALPCDRPCFVLPSHIQRWADCSRMCLKGCPLRRPLDNCNDPDLIQPCYEKMLPPTPAYSECRCNVASKPILCPECFPKFPTCPKPRKFSLVCKPHPKAPRLECLPRPWPKETPWSLVERCNTPHRCYNPWRADDHFPVKQWRPLPPVFPSFRPPNQEFIFKRAYSTMGRRAYSTFSARSPRLSNTFTTIVRKMSLWPPPPCRTMFPKDCRTAEDLDDPCIRELRRRTEGLGCQKEVRPATGSCYRWHKRQCVIIGNVSQYKGRAKPDSPFFPKFRRAFSLASPFSYQIRGYATGYHMRDTHSTFMPHYATRLIKCRRKCMVLKEDIEKSRNQTEGCCIVPKPCSLPKVPMERIDPLEVIYAPASKIPRLWPRPICQKLFATKNCMDIRNQTEGPPCASGCRSTFKLPGCTQRHRIDCAGTRVYFPCKKHECPHPSYSECKEDDPYKEVHECEYCQDSITPPNFYQRFPDCMCEKRYCKRTWSLPCEDQEKEYIDPRSFSRIRAFTTYGTGKSLRPDAGKKTAAEVMRYEPVASTKKEYQYSVKAPSDLGTVIYGKFIRRYSTFSRSRRQYSTYKHSIPLPKRGIKRLTDPRVMDPQMTEFCNKERCKELDEDCCLDTPENRDKFCNRRQRRDTYSCEDPPERLDPHCIHPQKNDCQRKYSTYVGKSEYTANITSLNATKTVANSNPVTITPSFLPNSNSMSATSTRKRMRLADNLCSDNVEYGRIITTRRQLFTYPIASIKSESVPLPNMSKNISPIVTTLQYSTRKMSEASSSVSAPLMFTTNKILDKNTLKQSLLSSPVKSQKQYSTLSSTVSSDLEKEFTNDAKFISRKLITTITGQTKRKYRANNDRYVLGKLVDVQKVDPLISEKCFKRKCKELEYTQEQLGFRPVCPKTPVCNTPENRLRYCHRERRDTYTCHIPPEHQKQTCTTKIDCWPEYPLKTVPVECTTDCGQFRRQPDPHRRSFSTAAAVKIVTDTENTISPENDIIEGVKETDDVMRSIYDSENDYDATTWDDVPTVNTSQNYKKNVDERYTNFKNGTVRKHFLSKTVPFSDLQNRNYSTGINNHGITSNKDHNFLTTITNSLIKFFKARPNCPDPSEYKKQQLIKKVQIAAKETGLELCDQTLKCENPCNEHKVHDSITCSPKKQPLLPVQCVIPKPCYKNPCEDKCRFKTMRQKKKGCEKVCCPGCRPVTDRLFCDDSVQLPPCHIKEAPYPSFSEAKTFDFARKKICECTKADYTLYLRQVKSARFAPLGNDGRGPTESNQCKPYSTNAPTNYQEPTDTKPQINNQDSKTMSIDHGKTETEAAINETPVTNQAFITNETSVTNDASATNDAFITNEAPVTNEAPALNEAPVTNEAPAINEASAQAATMSTNESITEAANDSPNEAAKEEAIESSNESNIESNQKTKATSTTNRLCCPSDCPRPLELGGDCICLPFQPPCIDLKPGPKPPCTPYELPPPPVIVRKPCPPPPCPPPKEPGCCLPHGPPVMLIDKCKRWRECCREPPKPKVFPCDEECKEG